MENYLELEFVNIGSGEVISIQGLAQSTKNIVDYTFFIRLSLTEHLEN